MRSRVNYSKKWSSLDSAAWIESRNMTKLRKGDLWLIQCMCHKDCLNDRYLVKHQHSLCQAKTVLVQMVITKSTRRTTVLLRILIAHPLSQSQRILSCIAQNKFSKTFAYPRLRNKNLNLHFNRANRTLQRKKAVIATNRWSRSTLKI